MNQFTDANSNQLNAYIPNSYINNGQNFMSSPLEMQSSIPLSSQQLSTQQILAQSGSSFKDLGIASFDGSPTALSVMPGISNTNSQRPQNAMLMQQQQQLPQSLPPEQVAAQAWMAKQRMQLEEQQRNRILMQRSMMGMPAVQSVSTPQLGIQTQSTTTGLPLTPDPALGSSKPSGTDMTIEEKVKSLGSNEDAKRVDAILAMNIELIRLYVLNQQSPQEPDIAPYKARLQSNLTYLATIADLSVGKHGEDSKTPLPPDLSQLPAPQSETAKKIHGLLNATRSLFNVEKESTGTDENMNGNASSLFSQQSPSVPTQLLQRTVSQSPQTASQLQQQQQQPQPQPYPNGMTVMNTSSHAARAVVDPQTVLRSQTQSPQLYRPGMDLTQQPVRQQQQQNTMANMTVSAEEPMIGGVGYNAAAGLVSPITAMSQQLDTVSPSMVTGSMTMSLGSASLNASDLMFNTSGLINPAMVLNNSSANFNMMGTYNPAGEEPDNYQNVLMMMQRLQQQQQQQNQQ